MTDASLTPEQQERVVAIAMDLAREGRTSDLIEFIEHGLPIDVTDPDRNTPLMLAAYHGRPETVTALIERGADVDLRNTRDQSPLAGALFKGEDAVVRALVAAGADLDAGTPSGRAAAELFGKVDLLDEATRGEGGAAP